jgi:putative ABC transport system permease protein
MNGVIQDVRYALRQLRKNPGFTAVAVFTLALGIGANTAMFSVIHAVLLKPLGYGDPDRLVLLTKQVTPVRFDEMKIANRSYDELGAFTSEEIALSGVPDPEIVRAARVSWNFLRILGVSPLRGRSFLPEEDKAGAPDVVMISARFWQRRFAANPQIIGKTLILGGAPHAILGVLPSDFQFPMSGLDVWVAKPSELSAISAQSRPISPILKVFGRLRPHADVEQANAELAVLKHQYAAAHPGMLDAKENSPESLQPLKAAVVADIRPKLWLLFGAVGLVLLIACSNVGGLLLGRASSRMQEFAVRAAIGAGRARIMRQVFAESVVLAMAGATLGLCLAVSSLSVFRTLLSFDLPRAGEIQMDGAVLGFALALSVITAVLFGLAPAVAASRPDLASVLRGGQQTLPTRSKLRAILTHFGPRGLLVTGQIAMSVVLLIGATLLIESLAHLYRTDPGFQPAKLLTMRINLAPAQYDTGAKQAAFYEQLVGRIESLPGVRAAAVSLTLPMTPWMGVPVQLATGPPMKLNERPISIIQAITSDYFRTMGISLKRGRAFSEHDSRDSNSVAIINESFARDFWPQYPYGENPIGHRLLMGSGHPPKEVVGISADVHEVGKDQEPMLGLYLPYSQAPNSAAALSVRTTSEPLELARAVQAQVFMIDQNQPVSDIQTMDEVVEESEGQLRLMMRLLGAFAGASTLLALIGLYGVISYSLEQRTKELGIRSALGAKRSDIVSIIVRQGIGLSLAGVIFGIPGALVLTRLLRDLLFQVHSTDPPTFIGISMLFVLVALLASYIPARRAAKVDPMVALRYE